MAGTAKRYFAPRQPATTTSNKRIHQTMATITHTTPQDSSGNSTTTTITIRVAPKPGQTTYQERKAIIAAAKVEPMSELVERVEAALADGRDKRLVRELKAVARERYLGMGFEAAASLYR